MRFREAPFKLLVRRRDRLQALTPIRSADPDTDRDCFADCLAKKVMKCYRRRPLAVRPHAVQDRD